jgi:aminopeptidase N
VAEQLTAVDPQRIHSVRHAMQQQLAGALRADWEWAWQTHQVGGAYSPDAASAGKRALANRALQMLCLDATSSGNAVWPERAFQRFNDATQMTDRLGALRALVHSHAELAAPALRRFYELHEGDALVIDSWFALQASAPETADGRVFAQARQLLKHPAFSLRNPNRARSLIFALCAGNPSAFHRTDAAGYAFWADRVLELDAVNPQLASRVARVCDRWAQLAEPYHEAARAAIARVAAQPKLSDDVREVVTHALAP